jgi:hypothetical protein
MDWQWLTQSNYRHGTTDFTPFDFPLWDFVKYVALLHPMPDSIESMKIQNDYTSDTASGRGNA